MLSILKVFLCHFWKYDHLMYLDNADFNLIPESRLMKEWRGFYLKEDTS